MTVCLRLVRQKTTFLLFHCSMSLLQKYHKIALIVVVFIVFFTYLGCVNQIKIRSNNTVGAIFDPFFRSKPSRSENVLCHRYECTHVFLLDMANAESLTLFSFFYSSHLCVCPLQSVCFARDWKFVFVGQISSRYPIIMCLERSKNLSSLLHINGLIKHQWPHLLSVTD